MKTRVSLGRLRRPGRGIRELAVLSDEETFLRAVDLSVLSEGAMARFLMPRRVAREIVSAVHKVVEWAGGDMSSSEDSPRRQDHTFGHIE
jgi:hypothetical protein